MSSVLVVITDVFIHQAFQMPFVENDHVVEHVPAAVAYPSLGNTILPRTSEAGLLGLDAEALHCFDDFLAELCTAIEDQVTGRRVIGECLAQLLNHPGAARMLRHVAVKDT